MSRVTAVSVGKMSTPLRRLISPLSCHIGLMDSFWHSAGWQPIYAKNVGFDVVHKFDKLQNAWPGLVDDRALFLSGVGGIALVRLSAIGR